MTNVHSLPSLWPLAARKRPESYEDAALYALEIVTLWGDTVLSVQHSLNAREFTIGDGSAPVNFVVPEELGIAQRRTLCEVEADAITVIDEQGERRPLLPERPHTVSFGELSFRFTLTPRDTTRFPATEWDLGALGYFGASLGSVLSLVISLATFAPPLGVTDEEELDRERLQTMLQILHAKAEREQLARDEAGASDSPSPAGERAPGPAGAAGKQNAPMVPRRQASNAPPAARDTSQTRAEMLAEAQSFGILSLLSSQAHPGPLWERDGALNPAASNALGDLFSPELGESAGSGGLTLSGPGNGAGGPGKGVDLDGLSVCNIPGGCHGGPGGFAHDSALGNMAHATTAPRVRPNGNPDVSGVLPSELVQRVVRQNFGRFRGCYEDGLRRNPSLTGRVTARFVIDRTGAVTLAQNGGSDLPDSSVVSCVLSAFYGLSFPAPDNGIVRVSYPILFSVG